MHESTDPAPVTPAATIAETPTPGDEIDEIDEGDATVDDAGQLDTVDDSDADEGAGDPMLDGYEKDLDDVAAALDALDADDLDTAESLAAGLDEEE